MKEATTTIFRAAAVRDAAPPPANAADFRPGAVAVREGRIVAVGEPDRVEKEAKHHGPVRRVDLPDRLILPAMVNAHAHLDLTDIGPVPYENAGRDFIKWIEMVMKLRPRTDEAITAAVRKGLRMSREAGVGAMGDVAGSDAAALARIHAKADEWIDGTSYLECFGIGKRSAEATTQILRREKALWEELDRFKGKDLSIGLQPHAPYSAGIDLYSVAGDVFLGTPSTHLAETPEEIEFICNGTGPLIDFIKRLGKWDESITATGVTPVKYLENELSCGFWLVAHCNYVTDDDIAILRKTHTSVAYCPIASEYFGHRHHRYRDMLDAGVNVCVGTDSLLCQPSTEPQPLGIMPQIRRLYRRDKTDPAQLLKMATLNGSDALAFAAHKAVLAQPQRERPWWTRFKNSFFGKFFSPPPRRTPVLDITAIRIDPTDPTDALVQALLNDNLVEPLVAVE